MPYRLKLGSKFNSCATLCKNASIWEKFAENESMHITLCYKRVNIRITFCIKSINIYNYLQKCINGHITFSRKRVNFQIFEYWRVFYFFYNFQLWTSKFYLFDKKKKKKNILSSILSLVWRVPILALACHPQQCLNTTTPDSQLVFHGFNDHRQKYCEVIVIDKLRS